MRTQLSESAFDPQAGWTISAYSDAMTVLSDARYAVPAVPGEARPGTLAWLRQNVCRFSEGRVHDRRRALVGAELARMDPWALRREARGRADHILDGDPADVIGSVARPVPLAVLGRALGVADLEPLVEVVPVVAAAYLTGSGGPAEADAAVAMLVDLLGPGSEEAVANRIAVLAQACEPTAALIGSSVRLAGPFKDAAGAHAESVVAEALRVDPPVPAIRRVAMEHLDLGGHSITPGSLVTLNVEAANRDLDRTAGAHLSFGGGRRPCPGADHAVHLAVGVVEAVLTKGRPLMREAGA